MGFKKYLFSDFDQGIGKILENYVFNFLRQNAYQVQIAKLGDLEVDFIAQSAQEKQYIQVCYLLYGDDVLKREYGNLEKIDDNWNKIIISLDDIKHKPRNGIQHVRAWELGDLLA